jgi:transmembrane sensor
MLPDKDYIHYSVQDFVMDDYFRQWVRAPDLPANAFWHEWLLQHPEKKATVEEAWHIVRHLHFKTDVLPEESMERIWQKLEAVYDNQQDGLAAAKPRPGSKQTDRWYAIAAVFALLLVSSALLYLLPSPANTRLTYTTQYGQTRTIYLPDSSRVTLNANSSLQVDNSWEGRQAREVWLTGEAYFDVLKKQNQAGPVKFIVHTGQLQVEVLGTAFTVNNRHGNTRVILSTGKVRLAGSVPQLAQPVVMQPGEYVEFSEAHKQLIRKLVDPSDYTSWTENKLTFENTPLREVAQLIEDHYGLQVQLKSADLAGRSFTATLPAGNVQTLLLALEESFGIKITRHKNQVILENH